MIQKRALDLGCLLFVFPGWALLMSGVALFIKVVSPGPVFYMQPRVGYRGRTFRCFKFRSMKPGAGTGTHQEYVARLIATDAPMKKLDEKGDPRLIPFGAFLRASGLDELPQLINIFLGEMSLVDPRPCTPDEYAHYLPWQKARFEALPGLTGLWQVSGKNKTTFREMILLDLDYVRSRSLLLDLKIMGKTFRVLFEQIRESRVNRSRPLIPVREGAAGGEPPCARSVMAGGEERLGIFEPDSHPMGASALVTMFPREAGEPRGSAPRSVKA